VQVHGVDELKQVVKITYNLFVDWSFIFVLI